MSQVSRDQADKIVALWLQGDERLLGKPFVDRLKGMIGDACDEAWKEGFEDALLGRRLEQVRERMNAHGG